MSSTGLDWILFDSGITSGHCQRLWWERKLRLWAASTAIAYRPQTSGLAAKAAALGLVLESRLCLLCWLG